MPKRKNDDVNAEEEDDETNLREKSTQQQQQQQQPPQKVYDFHKKTIEVYPQRLLELNRQFVESISSQVEAEGYSVLVGNCLDYVRQYFTYEDDLLQYSPWLATRLKQSRSDIVKCLQETIDVYEALARHDFDRIIDKNTNGTSVDDSVTNKNASSSQLTTPSFQFRPITTPTTTTTTATPSSSALTFPKATTTTIAAATPTTTTTTTTATTSSDTTGFSFAKTTTTPSTTTTTSNDAILSTGFTFSKKPTTSEASTPTTGFNFSKSSSTATGITTGDSVPSTGFSFKLPAASASPDKATNSSPFAFSIPATGFGTSTFSSPSLNNPGIAEKTSTGSASSISFAPSAPTFSFGSTPVTNTESQATGEENDDEQSEPPEPEKVEHETDAKLTYRCRMGVQKNDKFIKRGPVQAILKETNGKHQLIVRSDDTLGRLFLNILWCKPIEAKKNSAKDLFFVCQLNPGMPEVKQGEMVRVLLRFDNENDRNDAHDKLNKELE